MIMLLEFLSEEESWPSLEPQWDSLLARSATDYPFLRYGYQQAWWEHRGGGEWPAAELRIAVWKEDGEIRGFAPLFRAINDGRPVFYLIGSAEISDYLDVIAPREFHTAFCTRLLDALSTLPEAEIQALDLHNLHASSPTIPVLETEAARRGWKTDRQPLQVCPVVTLPASWDEYLESLDKKTRHEIRRKLRRAEGGEDPVEMKLYGAGEVEELLRLMALDPNKAAFLTPSMRRQFRAVAESAEKMGMLQLAFLETGERKIAAFFNFEYRQRIWVYNSGMDPQYSASSPGWVLLALLIRRAIETGCRVFDFMRGDEPYKFQWGGISEPILQLTIRRS
jgi:CelD/BcsL family acetyltransferase involved in cellulose biosynthesis